MGDKHWKVMERKVAEFFLTKRNVLSGSDEEGRTSKSDTMHKELFIEVKSSKKFAAITLWDKVKKLALREKKVPVVALYEKNRPGFWLLIKAEDIHDVAMEARLDTLNKHYKPKAVGSVKQGGV